MTREMSTPFTRRAFIGSGGAAIVMPRISHAATVTDATGRALPVPEKVARVFPAGPPAAILLYTLAPDLLLGWPRANRPEECVYLLPDIVHARRGWTHHGPRQYRQSGKRHRAQARSDPRRRLRPAARSSRWPSGCSSRPAFRMRCSMAALMRLPKPTANSAS